MFAGEKFLQFVLSVNNIINKHFYPKRLPRNKQLPSLNPTVVLAARSGQKGLKPWSDRSQMGLSRQGLSPSRSFVSEDMARLIGQEGAALCSANAGSLYYIINPPFSPHMGTIKIQYLTQPNPLLFVVVEHPQSQPQT